MLGFLSGNWLFLIQGTLVPKQTLGPFLTLSVRNWHKLNFWDSGPYPE